MDCRKAGKLIPLAADDQLDERQCDRLRGHMASCASCAEHLALARESVASLESELRAAAVAITAPEHFAPAVIFAVADESRPDSLTQRVDVRLRNVWQGFLACRPAVAALVLLLLTAATMLTATVMDRSLDSVPVASPQMYSGHLMTFTIRPEPDGRVVADVDARRYCQITRGRTEVLR